MASGWYRAQVIIPAVSALPADSVINVWSFRNVTEPVDRDLDAIDITGALDGFYTALAAKYSSTMDLTKITCRLFDLQDDPPRIPFDESDIGNSSGSSSDNDLPPEVSLCLSFKGAAGSGLNARRRRGRVYLGPFQVSAGSDSNLASSSLTSQISTAVGALTGALTGDVEWCVYSPYTHHGVPVGRNINETTGSPPEPVFPEVPGNLFDSFTPVVAWWVDNAWDTQRRRGTKSTARVTGTV